jgi:dolichol-phosphate mannosyltransferase
MTQTPVISVVIPVYRAERVLDELIDRIQKSINLITENFEIILVDDRSPDSSWDKMKDISSQSKFVRSIRLSRNFGQHYAITAGLDYARGEWIVVMDCDLQDQPEEIINLYKKAQEGFDAVLARRYERKDKLVKRFFSRVFYRTLGYLTGTKQDESIANFGIFNRKVIDQVKNLRESIRYFPTMVRWVGFNTATLNVEHAERPEGKSSYNLKKLLMLALDIILAYSDRPIRLVIKVGLGIAVSSIIFIFITFYQWWHGAIEVLGYASLIISIWFLSGCILITLGVVGLYVGKTFEGVKNRPIYIVDEDIQG